MKINHALITPPVSAPCPVSGLIWNLQSYILPRLQLHAGIVMLGSLSMELNSHLRSILQNSFINLHCLVSSVEKGMKYGNQNCAQFFLFFAQSLKMELQFAHKSKSRHASHWASQMLQWKHLTHVGNHFIICQSLSGSRSTVNYLKTRIIYDRNDGI